MTQAERDIRRKLRILKYAEQGGNVFKTCRYFRISRSTCYVWKQRYAQLGDTVMMVKVDLSYVPNVILILQRRNSQATEHTRNSSTSIMITRSGAAYLELFRTG